jgi:hypothetical protein
MSKGVGRGPGPAPHALAQFNFVNAPNPAAEPAVRCSIAEGDR